MYQLVALVTLLGISFAAVAEVKLLECPFVEKDGKSGMLRIWIDEQSAMAEVREEPAFSGLKILYKKAVLPSTIRLTWSWSPEIRGMTRVIDIDREDLTVTVSLHSSDIGLMPEYTAKCELKKMDDSKKQL